MTTIQINKRGTLTLPMEFRKKFGLEHGGVVVVEASDKGVFLKPAVAFPIEVYSEARVAEFDAEDAGLRRYIAKKRGSAK
jgi:bifunctional DNA-binding transcriptional regulator/antitoxin component of YhaV-PrlF toxin-antitoxin module